LNKKGFTLMEVTLFFAISGVLALVAIAGLGPRLRNVRFSSGMRDIQSNIVKEFSTSSLGLNQDERVNCVVGMDGRVSFDPIAPSGDAGTQEECVLVGRAVGVYKDYLRYYSVVARRTPETVSGGCTGLEGLINCYNPTVVHSDSSSADPDGPPITTAMESVDGLIPGSTVYRFSNGIKLRDGEEDLAFGYIQHPNGTESHRFFFKADRAWLAYGMGGNTLDADFEADRDGKICMELSGRKAALKFDVAKNEPEVVFEDPSC